MPEDVQKRARAKADKMIEQYESDIGYHISDNSIEQLSIITNKNFQKNSVNNMSLDQALRNNLLFNNYLKITELLKEHKVFDIVEDYIKESEELLKDELVLMDLDKIEHDIKDDVKLIMEDKNLSDEGIIEGLVEICENQINKIISEID